MTIHPDSTALLQAIPSVLEGVVVKVLDADGSASASFGQLGAAAGDEVRIEVPGGALVAELPVASAEQELVRSLLTAVADRERLEADMESMNVSAMQLLEHVSMVGDTLPRLSAGGDDAEIAALGVHAFRRAGCRFGVKRVLYVSYHQGKETAEVLVHDSLADDGRECDSVQPVSGMLADVLAAEGVFQRTVSAGRPLGEPGSVEHLAERMLLGVPVRYGSGDKQVTIGALLVIDRSDPPADPPLGHDLEFLSDECEAASSIAAMLGAVLGARKVASLGKELSMAHTIQRQILPEGPVQLDGFDIAAGYFACGAVGGDYFDYVTLKDGRTMVVIADVSGHNLASGMVMVSARAMLRTLAMAHDEPQDVFSAVAGAMYADLTTTERFLTAAAVALEPNRGSIDYVSAGHNDLIVYRAATDKAERYPSAGTIFGFLPEPEYDQSEIALAPGDCVLLYTDGIPEATDQNGEMFGEDRLAALFAQLAPNGSAQRILDGIVAELNDYQHGQVGSDDVTAVVIRCTESGAMR